MSNIDINNNYHLNSICGITAEFILWTLGLTYMVASLSLLVGFPVGAWQFPLSILGGVLCSTLLQFNTKNWISILIGLFILTVTIFLSNLILDSSIDGYTYHGTGMILLIDGWNPIYDKNPYTYSWTLHYCKALEIIGAAIIKFTGHIETGKCATLLLALSAFLFLRSALDIWMPNTKNIVKWIIVFVAVCNPSVMGQWTTTLNDSTIYSLVM